MLLNPRRSIREQHCYNDYYGDNSLLRWNSGVIQKISVNDLKCGMSVLDTGLSVASYPFLFSEDEEIISENQIAAIRRDGYHELFILNAEGSAGPDEKTFQYFKEIGAGEVQEKRLYPDLHDYARAQSMFCDGLDLIRNTNLIVRSGQHFDVARITHLLNKIQCSARKDQDALVSFINLRDYGEHSYTHSANVAILSMMFGQYLGLGAEAVLDIGKIGLFHDVGKMSILADFRDDHDPQSEEELEIIKAHPHVGAAMLEQSGGVSPKVIRGIREHHERCNGRGYPQGITGDRLGMAGQIVSLADTYDNLIGTCRRRGPILPNIAMRIIYAMSGKDFSRLFAERFIACFGLYPVGSMVRLVNGEAALVCAANTAHPLKPIVKIILDGHLRHCHSRIIDLSSPEAESMGVGGTCIAGPMDPTSLGIDPLGFLL